ncbi:hypothetical protein E1A91_D11G292200v1 [Gossypium mustelinum]|uniref:Uncharacterized protein n=1 Tax=Gossypium mustelinum TaxID=34275 RepID=A0A5D2SXL8_GOSMU|nr:hypothetical protein E1A91_D11G292200v1 [Gossypium mustelinum]
MHNDKQSSTIPAYQPTVIWRLQEQKIEIPSFTFADVAIFGLHTRGVDESFI